mgnify:CR=1 FL=1
MRAVFYEHLRSRAARFPPRQIDERFPASREEWLEQAAQAAAQGKPCMSTDAADLARALLAALEFRNGFQAFQLSGDYENKVMNMGKARRLLGWVPLARLES